MKKFFLLGALCLLFHFSGLAQIRRSHNFSRFGQTRQVRHITGISAVETGGGFSCIASLLYLGGVHYFSREFYLKGSVFYEKIKFSEANVPIASITLEVLPAYVIYRVPSMFYLNLIGGLSVIPYEKENGHLTDYQKIRQVKFGFMGGVEMEYYISNRFSLIGNFGQRYYLTSFGKFRWNATVGVRASL